MIVSPSVDLSRALFHLFLLLYPRAFRREFAAEMAHVFTLRCIEIRAGRGGVAIVALWVRTFSDVVRAAFLERTEAWRGAPSGTPGPASGSPPPALAAEVISRMSLVKSFPRRESTTAFLCLMLDHFE